MDKPTGRLRYFEKLKDPRWQKKRLDILDRDNFTCVYCGDWEETLHVHHLRYRPYTEPWECPESDLVTACETCHSYEGAERRNIENDLLDVLRDKGFSAADLMELSLSIKSTKFCCEKREFVEFFDWMLTEHLEESLLRYFHGAIPSHFVRANPGLEGRPLPRSGNTNSNMKTS